MEKGHEIWYLECDEPHMSGSLTTVARELARYKLDLEGIQRLGGTEGHCKSRGLYLFLWKRKQNSSIGNRIFGTPQNSISG
jgi:hypothetical protein